MLRSSTSKRCTRIHIVFNINICHLPNPYTLIMVTLIVSFMNVWFVHRIVTRHPQLFDLRLVLVFVMAILGSSEYMSGSSKSAVHVVGVVALARGHCPNIVFRAFASAAVPVATATLAALAMYAAQAPLAEYLAQHKQCLLPHQRPSWSASRQHQPCLTLLRARPRMRHARSSGVLHYSSAFRR